MQDESRFDWNRRALLLSRLMSALTCCVTCANTKVCGSYMRSHLYRELALHRMALAAGNDEETRFAAGGISLLAAVDAAQAQWHQKHVVSPKRYLQMASRGCLHALATKPPPSDLTDTRFSPQKWQSSSRLNFAFRFLTTQADVHCGLCGGWHRSVGGCEPCGAQLGACSQCW